MTETQGKKFPGFKQEEMDFDQIPYKDKALEKQRKKELQKKAEEGESETSKNKHFKPKTVAWSKQRDKKERKIKRREIKELKRKSKQEKSAANKLDDEDLEDLDKDIKLMKKMKKKKISEAEFEEEFGLSNQIERAQV